jgi:superfamily II DNA/RNA helicase
LTDPAEVFSSVPDPIQRAIGDLGWSTPTPVQARVIPLMIEGHDLIVQAHTGSGKTGAFGIPIAAATDPDQAVCQALVLAPTRELANQVAGEIATLGRHKGVRRFPSTGASATPSSSRPSRPALMWSSEHRAASSTTSGRVASASTP